MEEENTIYFTSFYSDSKCYEIFAITGKFTLSIGKVYTFDLESVHFPIVKSSGKTCRTVTGYLARLYLAARLQKKNPQKLKKKN